MLISHLDMSYFQLLYSSSFFKLTEKKLNEKPR